MNHYSPQQVERLIAQTAQHANILPLTSRCDARCIFCSHQNNPKSVQVISVGTRTVAQTLDTMNHLSPQREILIGESASSIIEGEPTLHPQFDEILAAVRQKFPTTPIVITTNGHHLTPQRVAYLAENGPIAINLSLNSATLHGRALLMGDSPQMAAQALAGVSLLCRHNVPFEGSLVAMPWLVGWQDTADTITFLAEHGARSVRVFLPGYSRFAPQHFPNTPALLAQLHALSRRLGQTLPCPILAEPSAVTDLTPQLSGVVTGSPAHAAGLRAGDVMLSVNGTAPLCRTHCFSLLHSTPAITATYRRGDNVYSASWHNGVAGAGVTLEYDFDWARGTYIKQAIVQAPGPVLALTSQLGHSVFQQTLAAAGTPQERYTAHPVPNLTFGGTIQAAGLLCVSDLLAAYGQYICHHPKPAALLVPSEAFNPLGLDLQGVHHHHLTAVTRLPVALT